MVILASHYHSLETPEALQEAVRLYLMAADNDSATAQYMLAGLYRMGCGVERDIHKAAQLYARAAERDEPHAAMWLEAMNKELEAREGL